MFEGKVYLNKLLEPSTSNNYYFLYKDNEIQARNILEINLYFSSNMKFHKKIMIDSKEEMMMLKIRIKEVCEIFPKISGLNSIKIINIKKKVAENKYEDLNISEGKIGDNLESKDIVLFDIFFVEIWLECEMKLYNFFTENHSKNILKKSSKILSKIYTFNLKVNKEISENELIKILIFIGIEYWNKNNNNNEKNYYYYLKNFKFIKKDEKFTYDSKIKFDIIFFDLTKFIFNEKNFIESHSITNEKRKIEKFLLNYIEKNNNNNNKKFNLINYNNNIIWKVKPNNNNSETNINTNLNINNINNNNNIDEDISDINSRNSIISSTIMEKNFYSSFYHNISYFSPNKKVKKNDNEFIFELKPMNSIEDFKKKSSNLDEDYNFGNVNLDTVFDNDDDVFFVGVKEFKKLNPEIINTIEKKPEFEFFEEKNNNNNNNAINVLGSNNNNVIQINKNSDNNVFFWKKIQKFIIIFIVVVIIILIIID